MTADPLFVLGVLGANVALAEWLVRRTPLKHLGSALLVILITAITANVGVIPTVSEGSPVYDGVFKHLAPLAIFWLLLKVNLREVLAAGASMITLFLIGSAGTLLGVLAGMWVVGGTAAFGEDAAALGGMFVGTYTGGSVNFNAIALHYGISEDGALFAGASVVDSAMTTVWMAAGVALPRLLAKVWPVSRRVASTPTATGAITGEDEDTERVHPIDLGILLALGATCVWSAQAVSTWAEGLLGFEPPPILVVTSVALLLAQLGPIQRLRGTRVTGMFAILVFLAVIGALCDVSELMKIGQLGVDLAIFVMVVVGVHGTLVLGTAALLRLDVVTAVVASQANIGGGTSALALARSLGRADLTLPAILVGSIGTALGTYLGFLAARLLG